MESKPKVSESKWKEQPVFSGVEVKPSPIDGTGCFAAKPFRKGHKIAEYVGERISRREIKRRLAGRKRIHICAVNSYWAIDGSIGGNGTQYINHSCDRNASIKTVGDRLYFYALKNIEVGEEITVDYVLSWHDDQTRCHCGAKNCRGTINKLDLNQ